jgi:hypothetical protein
VKSSRQIADSTPKLAVSNGIDDTACCTARMSSVPNVV